MTLAELETLRAAIPDDDALPATATRADLAAVHAKRAALDRRVLQVREALATLAAPPPDADRAWLAHLEAWRKVLVDELLTIKSPIRDKATMGRSINLRLSLRVIDFGPDRALGDTGYDLTTLRLGELMREAGFEPRGADPAACFAGVMPWFGDIEVTARRIADVEERRRRAQAQLDGALLDDDERERRERESRELNAAFNTLNVKVSPDANEPHLVAYRNGEVLPLDEMTEMQRRAFEAADAVFRAEQLRRLAVTR